ncbi:phage tail sheath family protein [Aetokthonos hydrillicola]|uniref:phage tail sheath family protein n=1 Tax=Aetokthonos hydrillicola TaxID=1550245 RepID=UPI001ABBB355|nr:phage tail sheath C-terminal domain-containing protein [Aetokthonos hydrillicola]MBO3457561.1 phage tail sheath family protein [Aetokthonos hydrillicola CCALA 1050]
MPTLPTYPGVYIEEIPSGIRTITGVATSITAFIGRANRGPVNKPLRIQNYGDFERQFGGLAVNSTMSYAVQQYFLNGGSDAIIVRVVGSGAKKAEITVNGLTVQATSEGVWMNGLKVKVSHPKFGTDVNNDKIFNLSIEQVIPGETQDQVLEIFNNLSTDPNSARYVDSVIAEDSSLIDIVGTVPSTRPAEGEGTLASGEDGGDPTYTDFLGSEAEKRGLYALEQTDLFNLLIITPTTRSANDNVLDTNDGQVLLAAALKYCKKRRAVLIIDPPSNWDKISDVTDSSRGVGSDRYGQFREKNAVIYSPREKIPDPLKQNRLDEFPPSGVIAGIMARTDATRGVWKAPAGIDATLSGVRQLAVKMTDGENGQLNPLGVNCLRSFPVYGNVVWGARTLEGADQLASEWKYLPVRRFALFLEESLYRGTQWVVFEPNDEPLWSQIRLNIGAFMNNLFRQGAFQGKTPREAYFVKCDRETTTQNDINLGIVNIIVGFAPLKPAEFVIIKFQQIAGQIDT